MEENNNLIYWVAYSCLLQGNSLRILYQNFSDGEIAWQASENELLKIGIHVKTAKRLVLERPNVDILKLSKDLSKYAISVITIDDINYPTLLKNTSDAPAILFYRGTLPREDSRLLAVVGSRRITPYSKTVGLILSREIASRGITLVSGLARGIDAIAHQSAIEQGSTTLAVVGTGLAPSDTYPSEHRTLADRIIECGGAILSEYPPGVGARQHHFPMRNRIIAGLSSGTLVIAAPERSGALITAYTALDENREVFAVPGPITELAHSGSNALLQRGAHLVTNADDVCRILAWETTPTEGLSPNVTPEQQSVLSHISGTPIHIDDLTTATQLPQSELITHITVLELTGIIKDIGGKRYVRI